MKNLLSGLPKYLAFDNPNDFNIVVWLLILIKCGIAYYNGDGVFYFFLGFTPIPILTFLITLLFEFLIVYFMHLAWKYLFLKMVGSWQFIFSLIGVIIFFAVEFYVAPKGWEIKYSGKKDETVSIKTNYENQNNEIKTRYNKLINGYENQIKQLNADTLANEKKKSKNAWNARRFQDSINVLNTRMTIELKENKTEGKSDISTNLQAASKEGDKHYYLMQILLVLQLFTSGGLSFLWHQLVRHKYEDLLNDENQNKAKVLVNNVATILNNAIDNLFIRTSDVAVRVVGKLDAIVEENIKKKMIVIDNLSTTTPIVNEQKQDTPVQTLPIQTRVVGFQNTPKTEDLNLDTASLNPDATSLNSSATSQCLSGLNPSLNSATPSVKTDPYLEKHKKLRDALLNENNTPNLTRKQIYEQLGYKESTAKRVVRVMVSQGLISDKMNKY